jgi:hypothetical protein
VSTLHITLPEQRVIPQPFHLPNRVSLAILAIRRRDARKQAVRDAAVASKEEGRSIDTGLSSDFSLPEDAQRGRNSRTVPQKRSD